MLLGRRHAAARGSNRQLFVVDALRLDASGDEDLRVADGYCDQRRRDDGAQQQRGECTSAGSRREVDEAHAQTRRAEVRVGVSARQRDAADHS